MTRKDVEKTRDVAPDVAYLTFVPDRLLYLEEIICSRRYVSD